MRNILQEPMTIALTRRAAVMSGAVSGIAAIGLTAAVTAAQDATEEPTGEGLSGPERARLAAELFTALVPVIVTIRAQTAEELAQAAKDYLAQLKEQQNITEEEGTALQQIVDVASSESDGRTKLEQIQDIVADLSEERDDESSVAATIAAIVLAVVVRNVRSSSDEAASPEADDTTFSDRVKAGIVGALAGAAIGGAILGDEGAVIGAIAGGLIGAI